MSQTKVIGSHCTRITRDAGITQVIYHNTKVVAFDDHIIILNTGGWKTPTTKLRMNQASYQYDLGYHVYQSRGAWYVEYNNLIQKFTGDTLILKRTVA